MNIQELTLKQKIAQMFITGFTGNYVFNRHFCDLLANGLGGVIFFSYNIDGEKQFKELIANLNKKALISPFMSIDQEGGRVERTEKIHKGKKYLSAKNAYEMGLSFLQDQTKQIALELKGYGINMNFAPVLDVNTNIENPIIGERAFSDKAEEVVAAAKVVIKEYEKYKIITVGKHFPGHGAASADSHKTLPLIDLHITELMENHVYPFEAAIKIGLPAIMVAHVLYPALEDEMLPASVSKQIISDLLIETLNFNGVVITDDMEMNGIKGLSKLDACTKAINAGVNMFIYRDTTKDICNLINDIEKAVKDGIIPEYKINDSVNKIINLKQQYGIIQ